MTETAITFAGKEKIIFQDMKKIHLFVSISLLFMAALGFSQQKSKCGQWRWDVKTLTDKDGAALLKAKPVAREFRQFLSATAPRHLDKKSESDKTQPRFTSEKMVVEITAYITSMTITADDHDFLLIVKSPISDETMFAELPDPDCATFDKFPALRAHFKQTWKQLSELMDKISKDSKPLKVKITGVPFWDAIPGERGGSSNGFEIHPVLSVTLLPQ
jgi:hypothetical protein